MRYVLIAILFSITAKAENISLKCGLGFGLPDQKDVSQAKYLSLGYEKPISSLFRVKGDTGAWFDTQNASSGFLAASAGMRVEPGYFYIDNYMGIAYIGTIDNILGIPFEFTEEFGIGVKDDKGRSTGIEYRHFSNAGISSINKGRDFLLINIGIPL